MVTVYTSTTCAPCKVAKKRLAAAGIAFTEVALDTEPAKLAELKSRLDRETIQTPLFEYNGQYRDMTQLRELIEVASAERG